METAQTLDTRKSDYEYLLNRYSQSLSKYDVLSLFKQIKDCIGNMSAATKEIEITRKTVYDWEKSTEDIKASTKRKILQACLESNYYSTIEFLTRKTELEHREVLQRYINSRCDRLMGIVNKDEFENDLQSFSKFLKDNAGSISDLRALKLEQAINDINKKADSLGASRIQGAVEFMNSRVLSKRFMMLLEAITLKTMPKEDMANQIKLPAEYIDEACRIAKYIDPVWNMQVTELGGPLRMPVSSKLVGVQSVNCVQEAPDFYSLRARRY